MTIVSSNSSPKIPKKKAFLVRNLEIIGGFFCEILQLEKFEGADFKYDNNVFQILIQNKESLVPNLGIFIFRKFCKETNSRILISKMTIVFLKF